MIHSCQIQRFFKVKLKLRLHIFGPKSYKNDHSASYVAGFTGFPDLDMYCATSPTSTYLSSLFLELKLHTTYIQATTKKKYTSSALEVLYNYFFFRHIFVDLKQNACIRWINLRDFFFTLIPSSKTCKSLLRITEYLLST